MLENPGRRCLSDCLTNKTASFPHTTSQIHTNMNYKTLSCLLLAAALGVLSCNPTKSAQGGATPVPTATDPQMSAWNKNVDAYHEVMSSTFHPAENGDLKPLKTRAATLAERAETWAATALPTSLKGKGLEEKLALLAKGSRDIANQVAKQESDEALTKAITALHDVFHEVVEMGGGH